MLHIKDQMVWSLMNEQKQQENEKMKLLQETSHVDEAANIEISQWMKLCDGLTQELEKFKMCCYYCKTPLSENNVNDDCERNFDPPLNRQAGGAPPLAHHGSGRHYFLNINQLKAQYSSQAHGILNSHNMIERR